MVPLDLTDYHSIFSPSSTSNLINNTTSINSTTPTERVSGMASLSTDLGNRKPIKILLRDIHGREPIPLRTIQLLPPAFEVKVGRGSHAEPHLHPKSTNAWFSSRVMSREHAILRADPIAKLVTLEDTASMHGTYVNGIRLDGSQIQAVLENEKIQFGAEIVRGDQTYRPLELSLHVDWNEPSALPRLQRRLFLPSTIKNSFSIDYSDEDEGDDDVEVVYDSLHGLDAPLRQQPTTFSVPDSDDSEVSEIEYGGEIESGPSSPVETSELKDKSNSTISVPVTEPNKGRYSIIDLAALKPGSTSQTALDISDEEDGDDEDELLGRSVPEHGVGEEISDYENSDNEVNDNESGASCFESENEPDDEEVEAFNSTHLTGIRACKNQVKVSDRAPSPSDAAMPKSIPFVNGNLPTLQNVIEKMQPQSTTFGTSCGVPPASPIFHPFGYYGGLNWASSEATNGYSWPFEESISQTSIHPLPTAMHMGAVRPIIPTQSIHVFPGPKQPITASPSVRDVLSAKPSKVSINDIIDSVRAEAVSIVEPRKRKLDDVLESSTNEDPTTTIPTTSDTQSSLNSFISTSDAEHVLDSREGPNSDPKPAIEAQSSIDDTVEKTTPTKKCVTFSTDAVIIDSPSEERPRKKLKSHHANQGSNILKYATTALVGAAVGAVGTVFGLAALPADYFT